MKIGIIGLGLIGGSLGRQIIKNTSHTVYGYDISEDAMLKAQMLNAYHERLDTEAEVIDLDILVVALCPEATIKTILELAPRMKKGGIIIDTCGTKRKVVAAMSELEDMYPDVGFVGVHPMAGREFSGISHSTATLFEHAYIILTPIRTDLESEEKVRAFFLETGCEGITVASAATHDKIIAYTSQLAHVVSSAYIRNPLSETYLGFSAGSFRDMTRVAKLNPDMWTELFTENKDNLIACIDDLRNRLGEYRDALAGGDDVKLKAILEEGTRMKEAAEKMRREVK